MTKRKDPRKAKTLMEAVLLARPKNCKKRDPLAALKHLSRQHRGKWMVARSNREGKPVFLSGDWIVFIRTDQCDKVVFVTFRKSLARAIAKIGGGK